MSGAAASSCFCYRGKCVTCAFSSVVLASGKSVERRIDTVGQSNWPHPFIQPGFPSGMSPFSSGLTGSLSSLLRENYSVGELKEWGHLVTCSVEFLQ